MLRPFEGDRSAYDQLPAIEIASRDLRLVSLWCQHGRVTLNVASWRPGDIILSSSSAFHPIIAYQQLLYPKSDVSGWTHVGMYDGTGFVWDANPDVHVQERSVGAYLIGKRSLAVARPRGLEVNAADLGGMLLDWVGSRYDLGNLTDRLIARVARLGLKQRNENGAIVCSSFLDRVLLHATGRHYFASVPVVVPADFAGSERFDRVPLAWCRPVEGRFAAPLEALAP